MYCTEGKLRRKRNKYQNIIKRDYGINLSTVPTRFIMVCNAGLVNGIVQEVIFEIFNGFGLIENIIMIPGKSYCFVSFKEVTSAQAALTGIINSNILPIANGSLFLVYAEAIPNECDLRSLDNKPPGLYILEDFVTVEEEQKILDCISYNMFERDRNPQSVLKNRRVSHFGYEFKYCKNNVDINEPIRNIPEDLDFIWDRVKKYISKLGLELNLDFLPDQLTVNNYQPGQGIPAHVDTHSAFEDIIFSLSLQSAVTMEFKNTKGESFNASLPARSMCVMSGESRYGWTHGITPRKSDIILLSSGGLTLQFRKERTSLTFRKVKQRDCHCNFPTLCDTKRVKGEVKHSSNNNLTLEEDLAARLEDNYVHEVYQKITNHFSETRHKPWPNVLKFVNSMPPGSILLDVGCGNGKYFGSVGDNFQIGCDASSGLMEICRRRGFECFTCNCLNIPLRDNSADGCISVAVIHHLVTQKRRKRAIMEIIRVLRPKGRALIYVWAKNQERHNKKSCYLKQKNQKRNASTESVAEEKEIVLNDTDSNITLPVHRNRTNFVHNDLLVPWKLKNNAGVDASVEDFPVYLRYYHVFEDEELRDLCLSLNTLVEIVEYYYDQGNWCVMLEKKLI